MMTTRLLLLLLFFVKFIDGGIKTAAVRGTVLLTYTFDTGFRATYINPAFAQRSQPLFPGLII